MKKWIAMLTAVLLLTAGCAAADQTVRLPGGSDWTLTLPDGMEYDGPGQLDQAFFAYVSDDLDISFICYDGSDIRRLEDMIPILEERELEAVALTELNGEYMLVYRYTPEDPKEMKCIGYILQDGDYIQEIAFWYATQEAADLTQTIMESISR